MRKSRIIPLMIGMMIPTIATFAQPSAEPDSWNVITESLDERGTFYLYMNTEQVIKESVDGIIGLLEMMSEVNPQMGLGAPSATQVRGFVSALGFDQIHHAGLSSIERNDQHKGQQVRSVMNVGEMNGLLSFFHYPEESQVRLDFIPTSSIYALSARINPLAIITTVEDLLETFDDSQLNQHWLSALRNIEERCGISPIDALNSLDGSLTIWMVPDEQYQLVPDLSIQGIHAAFVLGTRDSTTFNALKSQIPPNALAPESTDSRLVLQPHESLGTNFQPIIEERDGLLIIGSSPTTMELLDQAISGQNILSNPEFQTLSPGSIEDYDSIVYINDDFSKAIKALMAHRKADLTIIELASGLALTSVLGDDHETELGSLSLRRVDGNLVSWTKTGDVSARTGFQDLIAHATVPMMLPALASMVFPPNMSKAKIRSNLSRIRSDMRSMERALEGYHIDSNRYPAYTDDHSLSANAPYPAMKGVPTFRRRDGSKLGTLTTPIAYMTGMFQDPFAPSVGATFGYTVSPEKGDTWLLFSPGPDGRYDLDLNQLRDGGFETNRDWLLIGSYDPTNGITSGGDLWRMKQ